MNLSAHKPSKDGEISISSLWAFARLDIRLSRVLASIFPA